MDCGSLALPACNPAAAKAIEQAIKSQALATTVNAIKQAVLDAKAH